MTPNSPDGAPAHVMAECAALSDRVATLELANTELQRLLRKEANSILRSPDDSSSHCPDCQRYADAVRVVQQDNAQEHRWVEQFQKTSVHEFIYEFIFCEFTYLNSYMGSYMNS